MLLVRYGGSSGGYGFRSLYRIKVSTVTDVKVDESYHSSFVHFLALLEKIAIYSVESRIRNQQSSVGHSRRKPGCGRHGLYQAARVCSMHELSR